MGKSNNNSVRDSNFELLRLLAMFGIIVHHLVIKGASTCGYVETYDYDRDGSIGLLLNSLVVGGVNCFVLITGWFGVHKPMTGLIKVLMETMFFGLISYLILIVIGGDSFSFGHLKDSMDFRLNWFVVSYIMLLLICPILERSLKGIDYSEFKTWMVLLMIFNLVFVFYMNRLNDNGYNVVHFVFLYYIARFLRESKGQQAKWYSIMERYSWFLYLIMVVTLAAGFLFLNEYRHAPKSIKWFGYNNPILLLASISFFISIAKINIRSKVINLLATGVFGVFILHTTKYLIPWRNEFAHDVYLNFGYVGIVLLSLCILLVCLLITVPGSKVIKKIIGRINLPQYR